MLTTALKVRRTKRIGSERYRNTDHTLVVKRSIVRNILRTQRARRLRATAVLSSLSVASLGSFAAQASASPNFGGWEYDDPATYGSGVTISTPPAASAETVASDEIVLHRTVVHGDETATGVIPLIQIGIFRTGNGIQLSGCGPSVDKYTYYTEVRDAVDGVYMCQPYGTSGFGHLANYKIGGFGDGTWDASGSDLTTGQNFYVYPPEPQLHFDAGRASITSEINNADTRSDVADGSITNTLFAPGTGPCDLWCVYLGPGYANRHLVTNAEVHQLPHTISGSTGEEGTWVVPPGTGGYMDNMYFTHVP